MGMLRLALIGVVVRGTRQRLAASVLNSKQRRYRLKPLVAPKIYPALNILRVML